MGVRLYPDKVSHEQIERLAHVVPGTWGKLEQFEAIRPVKDGPEMDAWYNKLFDQPDLNDLNSFNLYGWGRLNGAVLSFLKGRGYDTVCGATDKQDEVMVILQLQGVRDAKDVTAVMWG